MLDGGLRLLLLLLMLLLSLLFPSRLLVKELLLWLL